MIRLLSLFSTTLILSTLQGVQSATYYVSASTGNDRNPGTIDRPWQSVNRANSLTSTMYTTAPSGHTILFCRGDEWWGSHLTAVTHYPTDSPLTYGSYRCKNSEEAPIISPAVYLNSRHLRQSTTDPRLIEWNANGDPNLVRSGAGAIWVGEERRFPARAPNLVNPRDATIQSSEEFYQASPSTITRGRIYCANLTQPDDYWTNATVYMRTNNWTYQQSKIIASGPGWIQTETWPYNSLCSGFFIENVYNTQTPGNFRSNRSPLLQIDTPGEFLLDNGMLMYYPVDDTERNALLNGGLNMYIVYADDLATVYMPGTGYVIQDLHFKFGNGGIVNYGSRWFRAYRNKITHQAGFGIQSNSLAAGTLLLDNVVEDADADCIWMDSAGGLIQGNRVTRCGIYAGYGFLKGGTNKGISAYQADVIGNTVSHTGYSGIEPHYGSDVKFNIISDVLLTLNDGGGIYMYGSAGNGVLVEGNVISNVVGNYLSWTPWNIASCVFTDEGTSRINIYNNTCTAAPQCMQLNRATGNVILSNKCNSPGIYLNNGDSGGNHAVVGNSITTMGTSTTLQNPIARIKAPGAVSLSSGVTAFYNNIYCQQQSNGNYLWQTDFGDNGVTRFYNYDEWVFSECHGNANCYFEQNSGFYYGNCGSRSPFFWANGVNGRPSYIPESGSSINSTVVVGVVVPVVAVLAAVVAALLYKRVKSKQTNDVDQTLASLPNGMLPVVPPLQVRTSSTSSVDYEQYSSPTNQSYTPTFPSSPEIQLSRQSSAVELSPQYVLHKSASEPMAVASH